MTRAVEKILGYLVWPYVLTAWCALVALEWLDERGQRWE